MVSHFFSLHKLGWEEPHVVILGLLDSLNGVVSQPESTLVQGRNRVGHHQRRVRRMGLADGLRYGVVEAAVVVEFAERVVQLSVLAGVAGVLVQVHEGLDLVLGRAPVRGLDVDLDPHLAVAGPPLQPPNDHHVVEAGATHLTGRTGKWWSLVTEPPSSS
jgi:hypothetical protein